MDKGAKRSEGKKSLVQFIKFALVGASNSAVDYVVSFIVTKLLRLITAGGWVKYAAKIIGYACGVLNSYIWNSRWTFREERKQDKREIISFIAVNLTVLLVSLGLIFLFNNVFNIDDWWNASSFPQWLKSIIDGELFCTLLSTVICIPLNFILNKLFVFKAEDKKTKA